MSELKDRWVEFFKKINAKGDPISFYETIQTLYSQPIRFYHTLEGHIADCLFELDQVSHLAEYPNKVEMTLWLHDIIYDTHQQDDEELSAQFARQLSKEMKLADSFGRRVYELILVTKHNLIPKKFDAKLVADIDLSILGRLEEEFDRYEKNIRKEYNWVPEEQFKTERTAILRKFLKRPSIYYTDFFRQRYETQAIGNLKRSLIRLEKS